MKRMTTLSAIMLACGLLAAPASAQFIPQATAIPGSAPEGINYQGRLEDGGFPVNATKAMIFRVYSAPVAGVLLWTSPTQAVPVALGLFSAVVPVPTTVLVGGGARYLEVSIDGTLMSPRELLNSVPYALIAKSVEGNIDVSTAGLSINANSTAPQPALYISSVTGNVGIGTGAPITSFDVGGSAQFGSGTTKSTFSATGALNTAGKVTAPDYTATYGINASTVVVIYVQSSSITTTGNVNIQGSLGVGVVTPNPGTKLHLSSGVLTIDGNAVNALTTVGRVGVGTALPASKLHLSSGTMTIDGNTATALTTVGNVGIGEAVPTQKLHVVGSVLATTGLMVRDTNTSITSPLSTLLDINAGAGNGSITAYTATFNINNNATANPATLNLTDTRVGGKRMEIRIDQTAAKFVDITDNSPIYFQRNSGNRPVITMDGMDRVGIRTYAPGADFGIQASTFSAMTVSISSADGTTPMLSLTAGGKLGIGVAAPNSALDIRGNETNIWGAQPSDSTLALYSNTAAAVDVGPSLRFSGQSGAGVNPYTFGSIRGVKDAAGASYGGRLDFGTIAGPEMGGLESTLGTRMTIDSAARVHINNSGFAKTAALWVESAVNHTYAFQVSSQNNTGSMFVVKADGNVGIGTTGPGGRLHVSDTSLTAAPRLQVTGTTGNSVQGFADVDIRANLDNGTASRAMLRLEHTNPGGGTPDSYLIRVFGDDNGAFDGNGTDSDEVFSLATTGTAFFQGNVGIGATDPASKLHMSSGTIIVDGNVATALTTIGNVGIGTSGSAVNDRLEVAGGNVRLTAVAGSNGSVKLFSKLTVGAVTCTADCGANTMCLAAWDSAGTISTCGTAAADNRCLCSGFGN